MLKNKLYALAGKSGTSLLLSAAFLSLILCGYKPDDKKLITSPAENQETIRQIRVLSDELEIPA